MKKTHLSHEPVSRTIFSPQKNSGPAWVDQRPEAIRQAGLIRIIQQKEGHAWPELPSFGATPFIDRNPYSLSTNRLTQCIRQGAAPLQLAVVQRTGDDIDDRLWRECLAATRLDGLVKTEKEDVNQVLWALAEQGGVPGSPVKPLYDRLLAAWNHNQPPALLLGKPTDWHTPLFRQEHAGMEVSRRMVVLGSDKHDKDPRKVPCPGDLVWPAVQQMVHYFTQLGMQVMPTYMGGYLHDLQALYGPLVEGTGISQLNINMITERMQDGAAFLVLHPAVGATNAMQGEVELVEGRGYRPDEVFVQTLLEQMQGAVEAFEGMDLPRLYVREGGVELSKEDRAALSAAATNYINKCLEWKRIYSQSKGSRRGFRTPRPDRDAAPRPFRGAPRTGGFGPPPVDAATGSDESLERRDPRRAGAPDRRPQPGGWFNRNSQIAPPPPPPVEREERGGRGGRGGGRGGTKYAPRGGGPRGK